MWFHSSLRHTSSPALLGSRRCALQVHHQSAQSVAERLARTLDLQPAFAAQLREPIDGTGTVTRSVVPYTEAPVDTEPLGWARFACALFSQMT